MISACYTFLPLHGREGVRAWTLVDADLYPALSQHRWHLDAMGYARRDVLNDGRWRPVMLHRLVLGLGFGVKDPRRTDHINRDKLDNRRENLRVLTNAQNRQNLDAYRGSTSPYRGVSWHKRIGKWHAQTRLNGKVHSLGYFEDEVEAAGIAADWRREHMPYSQEATV